MPLDWLSTCLGALTSGGNARLDVDRRVLHFRLKLVSHRFTLCQVCLALSFGQFVLIFLFQHGKENVLIAQLEIQL